MSCALLVFAGTSEGRRLANYLEKRNIPAHFCVATQYGETLIEEDTGIHTVHAGRMDVQGMAELIRKEGITHVVDATHPYATAVTQNIRQAAAQTGAMYFRLVRDSEKASDDPTSCQAEYVPVQSVQEAVDYLKTHEGNILAATGSKELHLYTQLPDYRSRVFARILSTKESVDEAARLGFEGKNLICMQGPFSEELNTAMLRAVNASFLVTKESGKAGGFPEKVSAARKAGARLIVVGRPQQEEGCSFEELTALLEDVFSGRAAVSDQADEKIAPQRTVTLVGIGMGSAEGMTVQARDVIREADLLIGASRMLQSAAARNAGAATLCAYRADEIAAYIGKHPEYGKTAVLLSGDIGFYSGAKKLIDLLREMKDIRLDVCSGISSVVYLCGKLHTAWEDARLVSLHGRSQNLVGAVATNPKVFVLVGKRESFHAMCSQLLQYGLGDVRLSVGSNLSYPDEEILTGTVEEALLFRPQDLCAVLLENDHASHVVTHGMEDELFIRGSVPMTKSEVRSISLSKLCLEKDSVLWDIGAGTGSVSVEAARLMADGMVFAIEKNPEGAALIRQNMLQFKTPNVRVIEGEAPQALEDLPAPTHAFLGGTSGNMERILQLLIEKNADVRIVINVIALESLGEALRAAEKLELDTQVVCVNTARAREVGRYHMMMGQNPVYVISCRRRS